MTSLDASVQTHPQTPTPTQANRQKSEPPKSEAKKTKSKAELEQLKLWLDFAKIVLGTVLVGIFSTIINAQIQYKQLELERINIDQEYLSQFTENALSDRLIERIRLANFFATVSFSEVSRTRWALYYNQLNQEQKQQQQRLHEINSQLPHEKERAENTGDTAVYDALVEEKQQLENNLGIISPTPSTGVEKWSDEHLNSRIIDESVFTWRQAIIDNDGYNGEKIIPTSPEHIENIKDMAARLQTVQDQLGEDVEILRWYTRRPYNHGLNPNPITHYTGSGVDIKVAGYTSEELYDVLDESWEGGMGLYPVRDGRVHLDNRPGQIRFRN
ncbi:hypothetical protein [Roseofilum capinflatum]|uniref:Peptidase M15A C-terminal domain-containing protein n=1 Tax=Roseofilum capinflatum BLCC-M114 TaxID=3022440 RepID=A0ABT7BBZ7_9CYAN|nr:hypothetical protein [Roseofilum capinflatum]MDJ1176119.1 hypothetical protein [Roseofilum capinflatum BLCC-M114]